MWKPLADLTVADLKATHIWELDDTATAARVRPTEMRELHEYESGPVHIALTAFDLPVGRQLHGFCSPADSSGIDYTQPVIITSSGQIPLWHKLPVEPHVLKAYLAQLECQGAAAFPIVVECKVPVDGKYYREVVHAI